jgi:hypothetical protein
VVEQPRLDRAGRPLLAAQAVGVGLLAGDAVQGRHALGGLAQGDRVLGVVPWVHEPPAQRAVVHLPRLGPRGARLGHHPRRARHRLDPAGDDDVGLARLHGHGGVRDGGQAAGAQPVHGVAADRQRQAGEQHGHPRHVAVVLAGLVGVAEDHLVDALGVDAGAPHRLADDQRGEVVRADPRQRPAVATTGVRTPPTRNASRIRRGYAGGG